MGLLRDHYHIHQPSHISVNKTVTEKRAPTDDSVKLLREMEKAAKDQVLASVRLDENEPFSAMIHWARDDMSQANRYLIQYKLGGERKKLAVTVTREGDDFKQIKDALVDQLAALILSEGLDNELKRMFSEQLMEKRK